MTSSRHHAAVSFFLAWTVGIALILSPPWLVVEEKVFDLMSIASAPGKSQLPITIVSIDEASLTQLRHQWPWPREWHARVLDRLFEGGARVIAFDVLFAEPGPPDGDEALAKAIQRAGNVVLAADHSYHETASFRQWLRQDPLVQLTKAGALPGLATLELSPDGTARRVANHPDAFWRAVTRLLAQTLPELGPEPFVPPGAMIRHLGPAHTFPAVSYYQVLNRDPSLPDDLFTDQVVLIGRDLRTATDVQRLQTDSFATPFLLTSKQLTPGVEIQATMIENALAGQAIQATTPAINLLFLTVVLLGTVPMLIFWSPIRSLAGFAFLGICLGGFSLWMFDYHGVWLYAATPLAGIAIAAFNMTTLSIYSERQRAHAIRSAFSRYVAPEVVSEIIRNPRAIQPGGERRELTVLFCDLAGFTTLSERLEPEAVTRIINVYLSKMTEIVMHHGGTVDKFIGDAIMAFWGAPLPDSEHARRAACAACDIAAAMQQLAPEFTALGAPGLAIRIGLHSGHAVVGNMGSALRVDYTALGDTVNLASRLEGTNKAYGTTILVSATTANSAMLPGNWWRPVDRVRVKGKRQAVDIFTPCNDNDLVHRTQAAWQAYLSGDLDGSLQQWLEIKTGWPDDPLYTVHIARLEGLLSGTLAINADRSIALDKL